ncbi:MAG: YdcF family protein [Acidimicrobiales bacterium]|nr:YdcF family protein [Acidimicrobiales bacterium]
MLRRRTDELDEPRRWSWWVRVLLALPILGIGYVGFNAVAVQRASDGHDPRPADAIVVLGAAQYDGVPSPVLQARLDTALELFEAGWADLIVTTGANQPGDRFTQGFAGYDYLRDAGLADSDILVVVDGADTYEELSATALQLDRRDLSSVILVSDPFHSLRAEHIAREVNLDAVVVPTDVEESGQRFLRETAAVSIGRITGFRRLSNWF